MKKLNKVLFLTMEKEKNNDKRRAHCNKRRLAKSHSFLKQATRFRSLSSLSTSIANTVWYSSQCVPFCTNSQLLWTKHTWHAHELQQCLLTYTLRHQSLSQNYRPPVKPVHHTFPTCRILTFCQRWHHDWQKKKKTACVLSFLTIGTNLSPAINMKLVLQTDTSHKSHYMCRASNAAACCSDQTFLTLLEQCNVRCPNI